MRIDTPRLIITSWMRPWRRPCTATLWTRTTGAICPTKCLKRLRTRGGHRVADRLLREAEGPQVFA